MKLARVKRVLVVVLVVPMIHTAGVMAQVVDTNGEVPNGVDRSPQQSAYGGQIEDLRLSVEDVEWISRPCASERSRESTDERRDRRNQTQPCDQVQRVRFTVWIEWLNYPGPSLFGLTNLDGRQDPSSTDGPEALVVEWNDDWTLVTASDNPSGTGNTSAHWTGPSNCPEAPPMTGRKHEAPLTDGSGGGRFDTFGFSRQIELEVKNPAGTCTVPTLQSRITYLHTYDDDLHMSWSGSVSIGVSVSSSGDAQISVGTNVNFTNNHGWKKSWFASFDPPANAKVRCDCCDEASPGP